MRKTIICIILCVVMASCGLSESLPHDYGDLSWLMELYGYIISDDVSDEMRKSFTPCKIDCGEIQVTLSEILYDGVWIHTAAHVRPNDPDNILIMPASAAITDFVSGGYQENLRDDSRSFMEAAEQDGKDIVCVYLYPTEFMEAPFFYYDHRQDAGDQSTLYAGAPGEWMHESMTLHIRVNLTYIPISSGGEIRESSYEFPIEIKRIGEISSQTYHVVLADTDISPFEKLTLTWTPLNTYVYLEWPATYKDNVLEFRLLDQNWQPIENGYPADNSTYKMSQLPEQVNVLVYPDGTKNKEMVFAFEKDKNE